MKSARTGLTGRTFKEWSWLQATVAKGHLILEGLAPDEASLQELGVLAQVLATCPDASFEVRGTLAEGATANSALSERRTRAVVDYLVGKGVAAGRLAPVPAGGSVIVVALKAH
jgi:hypothetical protein